jgi:hypothetical protein
MKLQLESTDKIVTVNGVEVRLREGASENGVPCFCLITRIGVSNDLPPEAHAEFERDLRECRAPSPAIASIPPRLIL